MHLTEIETYFPLLAVFSEKDAKYPVQCETCKKNLNYQLPSRYLLIFFFKRSLLLVYINPMPLTHMQTHTHKLNTPHLPHQLGGEHTTTLMGEPYQLAA